MKKLMIAAVTAATVLTAACTSHAGPQTRTAVQAQSQIERNKAVVLDFYELAFNQHKLQEAVDKHVGSQYIQHNPNVGDGAQAFINTFAKILQANPQRRSQVKQVIAEGDLVALHVFSQNNPQDRGTALVDIFRVESNGKIVEHWDVVQAIPAQSANSNSMF